MKAGTGEVVWKIDNLSQDSAERNDLSPQGYLLATDEVLVAPSGRSLPAVFDRKTGAFLHKDKHSWRTTAGVVVGTRPCASPTGRSTLGRPSTSLAMKPEDRRRRLRRVSRAPTRGRGDAALRGEQVRDRQARPPDLRQRVQHAGDDSALNSKSAAPSPKDAEKCRPRSGKRPKLAEIAKSATCRDPSPHSRS
ncbi:MAG: hypothetical protein H7A53_02155 [Akkermansiaceae bacterium]|nr:hypothetical protein [Akkermansiaceae bacterium]